MKYYNILPILQCLAVAQMLRIKTDNRHLLIRLSVPIRCLILLNH
jgi:hypothetical protein